jgi:CRISPR-associated protein (TIGR03986 family)
MARHINPNEPAKTATAPYNFVPLPNKIFSVEEGFEVNGEQDHLWEMHDQFVPGTRNGWIDLEIKTLTPLFIRGPVTQSGGVWDKRDSRFRPQPFANKDGVPLIPGSSLRGMIRSLVEVLSFSKISPVTDEKPFFRTVAPDRIGIAYRNRMIHGTQKPDGGYVRKRGNQWVIEPATEVLRVHRDKLNNSGLNVPIIQNPSYYPNWKGQQKPCWFRRDRLKRWIVEDFSLENQAGWEEGVLVLTGSAPDKKFDFVFITEDSAKSIVIPENVLRRFHDDDQLTQWQEKAFPMDKPLEGCRKAKGYLRDGEPVFFIVEDSKKCEENPEGLLFFGRAQMFRFPYDLSPLELIPEKLKTSGLDMAEALFGQVTRDGIKKDQAIKGRLFFEDAVANCDDSDWFEDIMVPHILASPKVTCFQHYLTQDGTKSRKELTSYLRGDHTTIRGTKNYWHRWDNGRGLAAVKEAYSHDDLLKDLQKSEPKEIKDTQHTIIRPVKENVIFSGRVRFENLADIELGALWAALQFPEGCVHKLGMGKPLGLGSVQIEPQLYLTDRGTRFTCWENTGANRVDGKTFLNAFEEVMLAHAQSSQEAMDENMSGLQSIGRLQALYHLLMWTTKPNFSATAYLLLKPVNQFRDRPVLPTPHKVIGQQEPHWKEDPPRAANREMDLTKSASKQSTIVQVLTPSPHQIVKFIGKGQTRNGILRRNGESWFALFDGDTREAVIVNKGKIPLDAAEHSKAEFYITEQSKKNGIKVRFEKLV